LSVHEHILRAFAAALFALGMTLGGEAALADVVAVVSAKSAITSLTADQVADIFLGRVSRFPNGLLAVPIDLRDGAPERDRFYARIAGKSPAQVKAYWSKIIFTGRGQPPKAVSSDIDMKKLIAANLTAIGYIDASMLDSTVRALE
jgi:ABC-type phosphate transport system substrate-binding protein